MIVYVLSRHRADELANMLGCDSYYSDSGSDDERRKFSLHGVMEKRLLVATSAFGIGSSYFKMFTCLGFRKPKSAHGEVNVVSKPQ
jgi:hypothetical protein